MSKAGAKQVATITAYCQIPKAVIEDLKENFHFYISTFDPNPYVTARNEGQRDVILHIESEIRKSKNKRLIQALLEQPEQQTEE